MSRKRHNVDSEATAGAKFFDKRSYVTHTGKEFRFGADKTVLRLECFYRDQHTCTSCGKWHYQCDLDMHHILPLGKGGDDKLSNVTTLCKWGDCHKKLHVRPRFGVAV